MKVRAHGLGADLPPGWEATIRIESREAAERGAAGFSAAATKPEVRPTAHFSTSVLPALRGDFGAEVVDLMEDDDAFVAILEYDPAEADSELFRHRGLPRKLDPRRFSPANLQRTVRGRVGYQQFFNEGGRAFCLYVVLGSGDDVHRQVRRIETLLASVTIDDRG